MGSTQALTTRRRLPGLERHTAIRFGVIGLLLVLAACGPAVPTQAVTLPPTATRPTPTATAPAPATLSVTGSGVPGCSEAPMSGCLLSFLIRSGGWTPVGPVESEANDGIFLVDQATLGQGPWRITGPTRGVAPSIAPGDYVFGAAITILSDVVSPGFSGPVRYDFLGCYEHVTVALATLHVQVGVAFSGRTCVMSVVAG